jgi:hypothetical protein
MRHFIGLAVWSLWNPFPVMLAGLWSNTGNQLAKLRNRLHTFPPPRSETSGSSEIIGRSRSGGDVWRMSLGIE